MKVLSLEIVSVTRFNENSDLSTTYSGRIDKGSNSKFQAVESFSISEHGYTSGKLLDGTECQLLLGHRCKQVIYVQIIFYAM